MIRKVYIVFLFAFLGAFYASAQKIKVAFKETFENVPPDSSTTAGLSLAGPWIQTTSVAASGTYSMASGYPSFTNFDTIRNNSQRFWETSVETNPVSTAGHFKVWLEFSHIAKVRISDSASIYISVNNGPWVMMTTLNSIYRGQNPSFANPNPAQRTYLFHEGNYPVEWSANSDVTPTNAWWKNEMFDITPIAANATSVRVKFRTKYNLQTQYFNRSGWYVDDVKISKSLSEVDPPVITHAPVSGNYYTSPPKNVDATIFDSSSVFQGVIVYKINNGPVDSAVMSAIGGNVFRYTFQPPVAYDGDTVYYYLKAVDNSLNKNDTIHRVLPNGFYQFKIGGPPVISYTSPTVNGQVYSLGPFLIRSIITDPSGIDSAVLAYRVNSGSTNFLNMSRMVGSNTVFEAFIPTLNLNDTVCYYVWAQDSSIRKNNIIEPLAGFTGCSKQFIAKGGAKIPYYNSFDDPNSTLGWNKNPTGNQGWVFGTPVKSAFLPLASAPNCWTTDSVNDYPNNVTWTLETPNFYFNNVSNAIFSFSQNRMVDEGTPNPTNGQGDAFYIEYSLNPEAATPSWQLLGTGNNDPNGINWYNKPNILTSSKAGWDGNSNGWEISQYRLVNLTNQGNVRFRFVLKTNSTLTAAGVAIDNFSVKYPNPVDVAAVQVVAPKDELPAGSVRPVSAIIRNLGMLNITSLRVAYRINGVFYKDTIWNGLLQPNQTTTVNLPSLVAPTGLFTLCAYSDTTADGDHSNDTTCSIVFGVPVFTAPYSDNFDSLTTNWRTKIQNSGGTLQWFRGSPAGKATLKVPYTAPNVWITKLTGSYESNQYNALFSPYFDLSTITNSRIVFYQNRLIQSNTGMRLLYSTDDVNWRQINVVPFAADTNWSATSTINYPAVPGISQPSGVNPSWTGNTAGWIKSSIKMPDSLSFSQKLVRFKFEFVSGSLTGDGIAIDNFAIQPPPAQNIGITAIDSPLASPQSLKTLNSVVIKVKNFGGDTITSFPVNYRLIQGINSIYPYALDEIVTKTILPGAEAWVTLRPFYSYYLGAHKLEIFTKLASDTIRLNDTIRRDVVGLPRLEASFVNSEDPAPGSCNPTGNMPVTLSFKNNGHTTITSIDAGYHWNNNTYTQTFNGLNVQTGDVANVTITSPINILIGSNRFTPFIRLAGDTIPGNDSVILVTVFGIPKGNTPFIAQFDSGFSAANEWCFEIKPNGVSRVSPVNPWNNSPFSLELGAFITSTSWATSTTADVWLPTRNPDNLTKAVITLNTPTYYQNLYVRMKLNMYSTNSSTTADQAFFRLMCNGQQVGLTQQAVPGNNSYSTVEFNLGGFYTPGQPITLQFQGKAKFPSLGTTDRLGIFIDSLAVYNKVQNSVGIEDIFASPPFAASGNPISIKGFFINSGIGNLTSFNGTLLLNGNPVQTSAFVPSPAIPYLQVRPFTFPQQIILNQGINTVCIITDSPSGQPDIYSKDDTLCKTFVGIPSDIPTYCNDFDGTKPDWAGLNTYTFSDKRISWTKGKPNKANFNSSFSGVNSWVTGLDSNYYNSDSSSLYTPFFNVNSDSCYLFKFQHRFITENLWDGGTVEYTLDGGAAWKILGNYGDVNWFNTENVFGIANPNTNPPIEGPGFSGNSGGWLNSSHYFYARPGMTDISFRFRFQSDKSLREEGWQIDDFCFEKVTGVNCQALGNPEVLLNQFKVEQNYPNPTSGLTNVKYYLPKSGKVSLLITDITGKTINASNLGVKEEGSQYISISTDGYNAGIYFYTLIFEGQQITKKLIVQK